MKKLIFALLVFGFIGKVVVQAEDWPTWRGPDGIGLSNEKNIPLHWSTTENVKWKVPLQEPENSSPIVAKGKVFITQALENGTRHC